MTEKIKKLETMLKNKAQRLNSKEELSDSESIVLDETISTLQYMQDVDLIDTWRWN